MFDVERDYLKARRLDLAGETARFEALLADRPIAALDAFRLARGRADLAGVLAGGAVLYARGLLPAEELAFYASALSAEGRHSQAVPVWRETILARPEVAAFHCDLAESLAAAAELDPGQRFSRALKAAKSAQRIKDPFPKAKTLARLLRWIPRAEAQPQSWARMALLIDRCAAVGAFDVAAGHLETLRDEPPEGEPSEAEAEGLVDIGLDLGRAKAVEAVFRMFVPDQPESDAQKAAAIRMAGQLGETTEAAEQAERLTPPLGADGNLDGDAIPARRRLRYFAAEALAADGRYPEAIRQLGDLVTSDRRDFAARTALQRCVGDLVLATVGEMVWDAPRPPKIFNLLPFYNERTLMEMRLDEMGGWVDHFVIAEATETFTGKPKPLHFAAIHEGLVAEGVAKGGDQFLSVAVEAFPEGCETAWAREFYQRDMAVKALIGRLRPDDIVLITDADEIVDHRALDGFAPHLASLRMVTSKHFLNYQSQPGNPHANRRSGLICRGEHLASFGSTYLRTALSTARKVWDSVPGAGWHFTSMGEAEEIALKFAAYAHQEATKAPFTGLSQIAAHLAAVRAGQDEAGWKRVPLDDSFPRFVRRNSAMLGGLLLDA